VNELAKDLGIQYMQALMILRDTQKIEGYSLRLKLTTGENKVLDEIEIDKNIIDELRSIILHMSAIMGGDYDA